MIDPCPVSLSPVPPFTLSRTVPLSRRRTRLFVAAFVLVVLALAVLATVLITRGWENEALRERVREIEEAEGRAR